MDDARLVKISKYLSKHLRHQPERLGLSLASGGWVEVDHLLASCRKNNFPITLAELEEVVARNDKQRFSFDASRARIRANQGHSVEVDLKLESHIPPPMLFHGTGASAVALIMESGLRKIARHHVHLSTDLETAKKVGARHGRPVVFAVDTMAMLAAGFEFFLSANGVWLVETVPPQFLTML
jgi:putative RNA 2'-phosphotransferase